MTDDIGLESLKQLRDALGLEPEWTLEEPRGFSWWGCERRLRVWAEEPVLNREGHGEDTCRLQADLALLAPGAVTDTVRALAEDFGEVFPLAAILLHADGSLSARCCVEVRSHSPQLVDLFIQSVALVWACGRSAVKGLAEATGRAVARSHPPGKWVRTGDCRLDRWLPLAAEAGKAPGRWGAQEEVDEALRMLRARGVVGGVPGEEDPPGTLWGAVPFPQGNPEVDPVAPALITVEADGSHPWLGSGAWLRLWLPPFVGRTSAGIDVLALNAQDARQDIYPHLLGSWRWVSGGPGQSERAPVGEVFLPNLLFQPGRMAEGVGSLVSRARALAACYAGPPSQHLDGALRDAPGGETLLGKLRTVAREAKPGWRYVVGEELEAAAASRRFLEALDAAQALHGAGAFSGATVYPHPDEEAPHFRWAPLCDRHLPELSEQGLLGLARHNVPPLAEASTDLGILAWQRAGQDSAGLEAAQALDHFERAAVRGCPRGAFNAGCLRVTEVGLKSLWRAVPLLRCAALNQVPGAEEALAWLNRWGRFTVQWL
jgi:hypothetical protein